MTASVAPVATNTTDLAALLFSGGNTVESDSAFEAILAELTQSDEANASAAAAMPDPNMVSAVPPQSGADTGAVAAAQTPAIQPGPATQVQPDAGRFPLPSEAPQENAIASAPPNAAANSGSPAQSQALPPAAFPLQIAEDEPAPSPEAEPPQNSAGARTARNAASMAVPETSEAESIASSPPANAQAAQPVISAAEDAPISPPQAVSPAPSTEIQDQFSAAAEPPAVPTGAADLPANRAQPATQADAIPQPAIAAPSTDPTIAEASVPPLPANSSANTTVPAGDKYSALRVRAAAAYAEAASLTLDAGEDVAEPQALAAPAGSAPMSGASANTAAQTPIEQIAEASLPGPSSEQPDADRTSPRSNPTGSIAPPSFAGTGDAVETSSASPAEKPSEKDSASKTDGEDATGAVASLSLANLPPVPAFATPPAAPPATGDDDPPPSAATSVNRSGPAFTPSVPQPNEQAATPSIPDVVSATSEPGVSATALIGPKDAQTAASTATNPQASSAPSDNDSDSGAETQPAQSNAEAANAAAASAPARLDTPAALSTAPAQIAAIVATPSLSTPSAPANSAPKASPAAQAAPSTGAPQVQPQAATSQPVASNAPATSKTAVPETDGTGQNTSVAKTEPAKTEPASRAPAPHLASEQATPTATPAPTAQISLAPQQHASLTTSADPTAITTSAWSAPATGASAGTPVRLELTTVAGLPDAASSMDALALRIASRSKDGDSNFSVRLDPPDLGGIEIDLHVNSDGQAQASLTADKPQTLDLLQRDSSVLERALKDAGLDLAGGLSFSLKGDGGSGDRRDAPAQSKNRSLQIAAIESSSAASMASAALAASDWGLSQSRLDIRI